MLQHSINILIVAEEEPVTLIVEDLVKQVSGGGFYFQRIIGLESGLAALTQGGCDICLLDITPVGPAGDRKIVNGQPTSLTQTVVRFLREAESLGTPVPVLVMADESAPGCDPQVNAALFNSLPPLHLDRSRLTPYLLERAMCFALERSRLVREVNHLRVSDSLTGLLTGEEMDRQLAFEIQRCRRYRFPVALIGLQLDDFSEIIGLYGGEVGDQILRWIAMIIQENIRTVDRAARYHDAEFLLLLPETDQQASTQVARRLQYRISSRPFVLFPKLGPVIELGVTAGIGIVEGSRENDTPESLVLMAERALREALRQRRNKIVVYHDLWPG